VAGATRADVGHTRLAILRLSGDGLEDRLHRAVGLLLAAGHDRRAPQSTLLATGYSGADVVQVLGGQVLGAALGVLEERVSAVDDHVTRLEKRDELLDDRIDRRARLHHEHHAARLLQIGHQFLKRYAALDVLALAGTLDELRHALSCAVVHGDRKAVPLHVQHQVLAHDGETDQTQLILGHGSPLPIPSRSSAGRASRQRAG